LETVTDFFKAYRDTSNPDDISNMRLSLSAKIIAAKQRLTGVNWILRNPGKQWTSSINPIVADPRQWYGEHYRSYRIGNEDLETTLRLCRLRRGNPFSKGFMPLDMFKLLLRYIIWADSMMFNTLLSRLFMLFV
jgi:hypothetical protein